MSLSSPPSPDSSPRLIAHRYEILESIARGGMGTVYRVLDRSSGVERALKRVFLRNPARKSLFMSAFEREYQVLAGLDHPRIIRVFDYGVDAEGPYYTMELVHGRDLEKAAPLPWRDVCLHMRDIATSLSLLHARRLLHRDLSPGNVKLGADGHCKLLDFGALSDFGFTSWIVGTPPMVPPEALRGDLVDQRADLYALGALTYWTLTGEHAFPARRMDDLPLHWETPPRPPSALVAGIPRALDELVLALLSADPLARPSSAAEVITRLNVMGQLALEDEGERRRLAQSFLIVPPFVGRDEELEELGGHIRAAMNGHGSAVRIEAMAGSGRSRLLEEIGVRAQIKGATVLRADASMHPNQFGTSRGLALRLLEAEPELARASGRRYAAALAPLGADVEALLGLTPSRPVLSMPVGGATSSAGDLEDWFVEVSRDKPLIIAVDNLEYCDGASLGLLVGLAMRARRESIFVVLAERMSRERKAAMGLTILREHCQTLHLSNLAASETLALARSLFGDAPNVERFADWLHQRTAGSPLHCIEISRQLVARDVIQHEGGMWALPASRPQVELPEALEDALSIRLAGLGPSALNLARCLSLQRSEPTLALCRLLGEQAQFGPASEPETLALLDELSRCDVLHRDQAGYHFSSMALRESLVAHMSEHEREQCHLRLGHALISLSRSTDHALQINAGWHLIQGAQERQGAELIAFTLRDGYAVRTLSANNFQLGPPTEAALAIFKRERRSAYERLPLLASLAQAGYYEDYQLSARYGDEALDAFEDVSGMLLARRARGWVGRYLALPLGLAVACLRFYLTPKRERTYSFIQLIHQLIGTVTGLVGTATIALDADRADRIADVLAPLSVLPEISTLRGVYEFCTGLQQIGREHQVEAFAIFDKLSKRFPDPRWYRMLPADGRVLYTASSNFARGAFAVFRADGEAALESAAKLDSMGLKMYAMIASQLRFLYYANRGQLALAAQHRELVELHAAHVGTAWQVELWEAAALLPSNISMGDVMTITRISRRMSELARVAPALHFYRRLGEAARKVVRKELTLDEVAVVLQDVDRRPPRSFIGWSTVLSVAAAAYNAHGRYAEARALCERALVTMTDADRAYVTLFLEVEIQASVADAGLGNTDDALVRLDGLIERFRATEHPLALGLLYETRARICYGVGRKRAYQHSLTQVEHYFRDTGTPALVAKFERLAELSRPQDTSRERPVGAPRATGPYTTQHTEILPSARHEARDDTD